MTNCDSTGSDGRTWKIPKVKMTGSRNDLTVSG